MLNNNRDATQKSWKVHTVLFVINASSLMDAPLHFLNKIIDKMTKKFIANECIRNDLLVNLVWWLDLSEISIHVFVIQFFVSKLTFLGYFCIEMSPLINFPFWKILHPWGIHYKQYGTFEQTQCTLNKADSI